MECSRTSPVDMLSMVHDRRPSYNNRQTIAGSTTLSYMKYLYVLTDRYMIDSYYLIFAHVYGLVGSTSHVIMVCIFAYGMVSTIDKLYMDT